MCAWLKSGVHQDHSKKWISPERDDEICCATTCRRSCCGTRSPYLQDWVTRLHATCPRSQCDPSSIRPHRRQVDCQRCHPLTPIVAATTRPISERMADARTLQPNLSNLVAAAANSLSRTAVRGAAERAGGDGRLPRQRRIESRAQSPVRSTRESKSLLKGQSPVTV
jgi:hypothetical protein